MAKDENGKVFFDADEQPEVDRVVETRLARERSQSQATLKEYEEALAELKDLGYAGTPAQVKEQLRQNKATQVKQQELREAEARALHNGTSPELEKEIADLKKQIAQQDKYISSKQTEDEQRQAAAAEVKEKDRQWNEAVAEFQEAYPNVKIDTLAKDERFVEYAEGKKGSLKSIYERYQKFIGEDDGERKNRDKESRSTGGGSAGDSRDASLTAHQKELLAKYNAENPNSKMTAAEFAARAAKYRR